jgi:hypothetical protein
VKISYGGTIHPLGSKELCKGKNVRKFPLISLSKEKKTWEFHNPLGPSLKIPTHEEQD